MTYGMYPYESNKMLQHSNHPSSWLAIYVAAAVSLRTPFPVQKQQRPSWSTHKGLAGRHNSCSTKAHIFFQTFALVPCGRWLYSTFLSACFFFFLTFRCTTAVVRSYAYC